MSNEQISILDHFICMILVVWTSENIQFWQEKKKKQILEKCHVENHSI